MSMSKRLRPPTAPEFCANCSEMIGNLEDANVYKGRVVCNGCLEDLKPKKAGSFMRFITWVLMLAVLVGGGMFAYGMGLEDSNIGGIGLFVGGGSLVALVVLFILRGMNKVAQ